jgi:hypothetical protein
VNVIICGIGRGKEKEYACPVCGMESDDLDDFATSMCWSCVYPPEGTQAEPLGTQAGSFAKPILQPKRRTLSLRRPQIMISPLRHPASEPYYGEYGNQRHRLIDVECSRGHRKTVVASAWYRGLQRNCQKCPEGNPSYKGAKALGGAPRFTVEFDTGRCAWCGKPNGGSMELDHNHRVCSRKRTYTRESIRGYVHQKCNGEIKFWDWARTQNLGPIPKEKLTYLRQGEQ